MDNKGAKRILHIIPNFSVGGAEKVVLNYLKFFNKKTYDIRAISFFQRTGTIYEKEIDNEGLNVIFMNKKLGLDLSIIFRIKRIINEFKPEVVHGHLATMKYLIPALFFIRNKPKIYHTIHTEPDIEGSKLDKVFNALAFKCLKYKPVALNKKQQFNVNSFYKINSTAIIHNAIDAKRYCFSESIRTDIRNEFGIENSCLLIGHVGRFIKAKNHHFIINIFKELHIINRNSKLLLVGEGKLLDEIKALTDKYKLSQDVIFTGVRSDIPDLLQAIDVFIFPSLYEGLGIVAIEAQAAGLPCLASNTIPKDVKITSLIEFESLNSPPRKWAQKIIKLSKEERRDMYNEIIEAGYDVTSMIKDLEALYNE